MHTASAAPSRFEPRQPVANTNNKEQTCPACLPARRLPVNPALSQAPAENPKIMSLPGVRCFKT